MGWIVVALVALLVARAESAEPSVEVSARDGGLSIEARAVGPGSPEAALRLLRDFATLVDYMPNADSSYVVAQTDSSTLVRQVVTSRLILPWTFRFTLEFMAVEDGRMRFRQVEGGMKEYRGSWRAVAHPQGVEIIYAAFVRTRWKLPFFMMSIVVRRQVGRMMPALLRELARREVDG